MKLVTMAESTTVRNCMRRIGGQEKDTSFLIIKWLGLVDSFENGSNLN